MAELLSWREEGDVVVITWDDGENRINLASMAAFHGLLDTLEAREGPLALVVTGKGKIFSNGLDLDRFAEHPDELVPAADALQLLLGRLLVFPAYCVAAINGHAFAGGAMLAAIFDYKVMREDRGYWCLNEAEIGIPLSPQMTAAVTARLPRPTAATAMLTARRYDAPSALAAGIIDATAAESEVLSVAIEAARVVATKDRRVVANHKRQLSGEAAAACGWTTPRA